MTKTTYPALKIAINGVEHTFANYMDHESGQSFAECFNEKFPGSFAMAHHVDVDVPDVRLGSREFYDVEGEFLERVIHD